MTAQTFMIQRTAHLHDNLLLYVRDTSPSPMRRMVFIRGDTDALNLCQCAQIALLQRNDVIEIDGESREEDGVLMFDKLTHFKMVVMA